MQTWQMGGTGKTAWLHRFGPQTGTAPLVWLLAGDMTQDRIAEMETLLMPLVQQGRCPSFVMAGFGPAAWDDDYAPWPLEMPDGRRFGSGADALLRFAQAEFLPAVRAREDCGAQYVVGYSLGGLAALYFAAHGGWDGCGSCSGSLWYPGFEEWLAHNRPGCPVYLSLGGREKNTRDPLMARVEDCTKAVFDQLRPHVRTTFVHEPGGHFRETSQRLARAVTWLLDTDQSRKR